MCYIILINYSFSFRGIMIINNALWQKKFKFCSFQIVFIYLAYILPSLTLYDLWHSFYIIIVIIVMKGFQLQDGVLSQTTTLVKNLQMTNGQCTHTNIVKIIRNQNEPECPSPRITSSISEHQRNTLKRFTQIEYLQKKYIVQDVFQFSVSSTQQQSNDRQDRSFISSSQQSGNSQQQSSQKHQRRINRRYPNKKICIFQRKIRNGRRFLKRNTKNIPKNFCKAFLSYMQKAPNRLSAEWNLVIRDFKKLEKKSKYNNILIRKLLSNCRIVPYFKQFLENHAEEWITNSKITDKQVHIEAIKIYLQLLGKLSYAQVDPSPSDQ